MIPCQFFALGQCGKGKACTFSHDSSVCRPGGAGKLCKNFASTGICRNGERCVFIHQSGSQPEQAYFYGKQPGLASTEDYVGFYGEAPAEANVDRRQQQQHLPPKTSWATIARLPNQDQYDSLKCGDGDSLLSSKLQGVNLSSETVQPETRQPQQPLMTKKTSSVPCKFHFSSTGCRLGSSCRFSHTERAVNEKDEACCCGICFDSLKFKRIGILTHCDHIFCLTCIRGWRSSEMSELERTKENVQTCPVCRVRSFFVVPADSAPRDAEEKKRVIDAFKEKCSKTPCRYKDNECPFGTSCLYYHQVVDPAKLGLRFAKTAEGADRALSSSRVATLGDFILK